MPRALRSPVASGPTRRAAKCFGSKRGRRALHTAPALPDFQFLDRQRRKLRRVMDTSLGDLDDRLRDHFRQGVVAILDAEGMQRLLVSSVMRLIYFRSKVQFFSRSDK